MTDNGAGGLGEILCHTCQKPVRFAATNVEHLDGSALCIESVPLTDNRHLPECWVKYESDPSAWCICDELRACEKRVREDEQSHNFSPDIHWDGMAEAYQRGLDVAREAIADINGKWVFGPRIYKHKALAAIDALRARQ